MVERTATRVAFGEVVRLSKERTSDPDADGFDRYVGLEHIEPGDLRIRRWGEVADGTTFTNVFRPGQVLFGKRRAYQRKVAVADFEGVCSGDIYVLESKDPSVLVPELLPFVCLVDAFNDHAVGTSAGSLSPRTNWSSLAKFELTLPSPSTQQQLVELLQASGLVEEALRRVEATVRQLRSAHTHELFKSNSRLARAPLSELATRVGVGIASSVTHAYADSGIPIIQNSNIRRGSIDFTGGRFITEAFDKANATKRLRAGDVVIARTGVPGAASLVPDDFVGGHTFTTLIVSPDQSRLLPAFLELWLNATEAKAFFASRKAGGVQQNMNATVLAELPVPRIPIEDQKTIVETQREYTQAEAVVQCRLRSASSLRVAAMAGLSNALGSGAHV